MPYDMSQFMPSKSAYTNPGEYETTQRSLAYQNATYMSNMDAFYKKLEEDARQFDLSLDLKRDEFGLEQEKLAFQGEKLAESTRQFDLGYDLSQDIFEENQKQFDVNTGLSEQELDIAGRMADIREQESMLDYYAQIAGGADLLLGEDGMILDIVKGVPKLWDALSGLWEG